MKHSFTVLYLFLILFTSCNSNKNETTFTFESNDQGIELRENNQPVFFYQRAPKSLKGEYICNNYLHPLYSLNGDILTEEFPLDHQYHRGIFWAWHQVYINGNSVGNSWIMENLSHDVIDLHTSARKGTAKLVAEVQWKSPIFENEKPFISEKTTITVHPLQDKVRKIDFAIALRGLLPGVELGGAADEKGYGGFCTRVKLPEDIAFTSEKGKVEPKTLQVVAGPWMDISGSMGENSELHGITILCHPETPNYPAPWILRSKTSMQNVVFPGSNRIELPTDEPLVLYYRLIIHEGNFNSIDPEKLQAEYENFEVLKQ